MPEGSKVFYGYKEILSKYSGLFAAALGNGWKESGERVVNLPEQTPDSFEIFLCFAYHGEIRSRSPEPSGPGDSDETYRLQRCWALGEKLACTAFQDAAMDALTSKLASGPTDWHEFAYQFTSTPNSLSRLTVDIAAHEWSSAQLGKISANPAKYSGFLLELASRLLNSSLVHYQAEAPYFGETECRYHEHVKRGLPRYKTLHHG